MGENCSHSSSDIVPTRLLAGATPTAAPSLPWMMLVAQHPLEQYNEVCISSSQPAPSSG